MILRRYWERPESRASVREWVGARNSSFPLGFDTLCDYIDLDADCFRDGLMRWMNKVDGSLGGSLSLHTLGNPATNWKSSGW